MMIVCMSFCKFGGFVNITLMHHTQYKKNLFLAYHITTCSTTSTMSKKNQGSNLSVNLSSFKKKFFDMTKGKAKAARLHARHEWLQCDLLPFP